MNWHITSQGVLKGCSTKKKKDITELLIPDRVKTIGDGAFQDYRNLKSVIIPEGITSIGCQAFEECISLSNIVIPETVTSIGVNAFHGTAWMDNYPDDFVIVNHILINYKGKMWDIPEEFYIPEGIHVINSQVLYQMSGVKKLILPEGLKLIEAWAFTRWYDLEEVQFPASVEKIGQGVFSECSDLKRVSFQTYSGKFLYRPDIDKNLYFAMGLYRSGINENFWLKGLEQMVQNHNYEITSMLPEVKHDLISQMYNLNIDKEGIREYIQKHFTEMIPVLIRLDDTDLIQKVQENLPDLIRKHIDTLIQEAIDQKKHKVQVMLMDYKYQNHLFRKKDWSLS